MLSNFYPLDKPIEETLNKLIILEKSNEIIEIFSEQFSLSEINELARRGFISKPESVKLDS